LPPLPSISMPPLMNLSGPFSSGAAIPCMMWNPPLSEARGGVRVVIFSAGGEHER
jgi:hypothetical protein